MGFLKVEKRDGGLVLVPDADAAALLEAVEGEMIQLERQPDGSLGISRARSDEERLESGRAFLARYRGAFETLAK